MEGILYTWLMHFVVWQKLTQHCTLSSNFLKNHFNISFLIAFEVFKWLSCLSSLRHHWWKRDYMFLSNTWVWHCSLHVLKKKKKKVKGISSLEKHGLTHISRDFRIDLHVGKALFTCWKAWSGFILIIYSFLGTGEMTPRRGAVWWPTGWGA